MAKQKSHSSWSAVLFKKSPMNKRKDDQIDTTVTTTKTKTDICQVVVNNQTDVTKTATTTDEQNNNEITKTKSETDLTCSKMHRQQKQRLSLKRLRFLKKSSSSCSLCQEESGSLKDSPKISEKSSSKVTTKAKSKPSKITNEGNTQPATAVLFDIIQYKDLNLLHDVFKSYPNLDINAFNEDGIAAIHFAAMSGSTSCIEAMVDYGADINLLDIRGNPPLHYAILMKKFEFAGKLMELGAVTHQLSKHQYPELKKKSRDTWHF